MSASSSFSPTCPSCQRGDGLANSVGITGDQRTITYRCSSCSHTWTATDTVPRLVALYQPNPSPQSRSVSE